MVGGKRKGYPRVTGHKLSINGKKTFINFFPPLPPIHKIIDETIHEIQKSKVEAYIKEEAKKMEKEKKIECPYCRHNPSYVNKNGVYYGRPGGKLMQKYRCQWCEMNFMKPIKPPEPAVIKQPEKPAVALAKTTLESQLEKKVKELEKTIKTQQDRNDQNIRLKESLYKTEIDKREKLVKKLKTKIFKLEGKVHDLELERDGKIKFITDNPDFLEIT